MKKPKFKFVESEQANGCAAACAAMILGMKYEEVVFNFHNDFEKKGIDGEPIAHYLSENGVDVIRVGCYGYSDRKIMNTRLLKPFADIHCISYKQFVDSDMYHMIIMLSNGKLICPNIKHKITYSSIYEVDMILGCFYDK